MSELALHFQVWKLITAYKRRDVLAWHTPNGEKRDKRTAARLKAMGVIPGVADFALIVKGKTHFLELKDVKGSQRVEQRIFECDAEAAGASYFLARSLREAIEVLNQIGALRFRLTPISGAGGFLEQSSLSPRRTEATA